MKLIPCSLLLLLFAACGDQVQKAAPPVKPGVPAGHPEIGRPSESRPAHGDPFVEPEDAGKPAMGAAQVADPERVVFAGEISIDPAVTLGAKYTVYVSTVYGREERAPVLVKKYETPKFPFKFELREKDSGMGPRQSDRPLYVRAMISDTGDVMKSRNRTTSETAYPLFTQDVKLTIK